MATEWARCAVLYPAVAEAARRAGAEAVGLVDLFCGAGLNLVVDRVGIGYDDGRTLGDPSAPVRVTCSIVGERPVPATAIPEVVARIGIDRAAPAESAPAPAAEPPLLLLRGNVLDVLPDAIARVPAGALPVVTTTWALSRIRPARRPLFLDRLREAAEQRPVAWASVEGVGVAPGIPTFGDRPASGHSIVGVAVLDGPDLRTEAVGRCWSRGRLMSWLAP